MFVQGAGLGVGEGAQLTKPGWSKPHIHSKPTNLALFRHKIILYRFSRVGGAHTIAGGSNGSRRGGQSPPPAPSLYPLIVWHEFCIELLYGVNYLLSLCMLSWCLCKVPDWRKLLSHSELGYGLSSVCVVICLRRIPHWINTRSHTAHRYGFSPCELSRDSAGFRTRWTISHTWNICTASLRYELACVSCLSPEMSVNLWPRSEALGTPIGVIGGRRKSIKPEYNLRIIFPKTRTSGD